MSDPPEDPPHAGSHYRDAHYYDHAYARYKPDLAFYVGLATESGGPVLELGAGTGRVSRAIAREGVDVVAIDKMPSMVERAVARLAKEPRRVRDRIQLLTGDLRETRLDARFELIIAPFNVFQHLYTREDVERALDTVTRHLAPEGRFAFDVLLPEPTALARDPRRFYKCRPITHPRDKRRYAYSEAFEYDHDLQVQSTTMRFAAIEDDDDAFYDRLVQRQFFPRELEALLHYNGFAVLRHDGGFAGEAIDAWSESQVIIARRR